VDGNEDVDRRKDDRDGSEVGERGGSGGKFLLDEASDEYIVVAQYSTVDTVVGGRGELIDGKKMEVDDGEGCN
jgi:hypothetical protein